MQTELSNHDKISPTAKMVAYWRQFAEIPFSKDIAEQFEVENTLRNIFGQDMENLSQKDFFVPLLEIRYKCIQNFISQSNIKQALEFASGISLRGLAMTNDPNFIYVETDLAGLTNEKIKLVQSVMSKNSIPQRSNLFFHVTDILNYSEIEFALQHFDSKKTLIIVNEGLLQYLTKEEKKIAAQNIYRVLSRFGGVWITPDLDTRHSLWHHFPKTEDYKKMIDILTVKTERNFDDNAFEDDAEIFSFFQKIGFNVNYQPQWSQELNLSSINSEQISYDILEAMKRLRLWSLTVK